MPSKFAAVLAIAATSGLAMLLAIQTWVAVEFVDGAAAVQSMSISGQELQASIMPIALAGLAAALALTIAGPAFRIVLGAIVTLLGAGIAWLVSILTGDVESAVSSILAESTGLVGAGQFDLVEEMRTLWLMPTTLIAGIALALCGLLVLFTSRGWRTGGRKYAAQRVVSESVTTGEPDRFDDWDRQSEGADPTDRDNP